MRKTIFIFLFCLIFTSCAGGPGYLRSDGYNLNENRLTFIITHDKTKNEAYAIAENWIAKNYNSANYVIQQKDVKNSIIVVKALAPCKLAPLINGHVHYTFEIKNKDNKSKITFVLGGIRFADDGTESPHSAPPTNSMATLNLYFRNIKNKLSIEWNNQLDDF